MTPWQTSWKNALRTAEDLKAFELISDQEAKALAPVLEKYKFVLPLYYARLIDKGDPSCPIRLQAIPSAKELENPSPAAADPLGDLAHQPMGRVTHRYPNRVLLHLTPNCSMYCRFCFRKTLLNELKTELFQGSEVSALHYLSEHPEVSEVIFSGGDPFMLASDQIAHWLLELGKLEHIERVRFHTRVPVTFPERLDDELIQALNRFRRPPVVITHFNHPKEITTESREGLRKLRTLGGVVFNQSVLLKGVNSEIALLAQLNRDLFAEGVVPYYLHHPDRAEGTLHFDISLQQGVEIYEGLKKQLPGYLVPKYVRDSGDSEYKTELTPFFEGFLF